MMTTAEPPAFVLAIDHRNSLRHWYMGLTGAAAADTATATAALTSAKALVAEALLTAATSKQGQPMLLIDEEYGGDAIAAVRAGNDNVQVVIPAERSGQPEFIFEHGDDFGACIEASGADIVKALVRYNPSGDPERNARSRTGLLRLAEWLDEHNMPLMLELLVPPTPAQASEQFDNEVRPGLTREAIGELSRAGLSPAFWKVEGQPSTAEFASLAAATANGRCLVLGRGEDAAAVGRWVAMAAAAPGFSGFAVGRTIWAEPLGEWLTGTRSRDDAVATISANYLHFVHIYLDNTRTPSPSRPLCHQDSTTSVALHLLRYGAPLFMDEMSDTPDLRYRNRCSLTGGRGVWGAGGRGGRVGG
jgi:myo-inositol catabolism protein IolC